jgi:predicted dehydrogenase
VIHREWQKAGGARRGLASNLVLRSAPLYRRLRQAIRAQALGHIYAVDGEYLYGRLHKITEGWRVQVENYSVMQGGGVHMIDLVHWMLGQHPDWVSADGNRICTEGTAFRYLDYVTASAGYADGCLARFTANFGCVHRHQHVLRIYGTKGTFIYDDAGARFHASRDPALPPEIWTDKPLPETKGDLIPAFVQGVIEGKDWAEDVKTIMDDISVCVACDLALTRGEKVKVEYT